MRGFLYPQKRNWNTNEKDPQYIPHITEEVLFSYIYISLRTKNKTKEEQVNKISANGKNITGENS
jgi:hypothetical protein